MRRRTSDPRARLRGIGGPDRGGPRAASLPVGVGDPPEPEAVEPAEPPGGPAWESGWVPGEDLDPPSGDADGPLVRRQRRGPWGRLASRWVPESLRDSRVDPGRRGATVLVAVAALAAVIAAIGVWRSKPEPRPVTAVALPVATSAAPSSAVEVPSRGSRASPAAEPLVVAVTGWVVHPGLVRLAPGARLADALTAAGGPRPGADLTGLNLAEKLGDGEAVVVAGPDSVTPSVRSGVSGGHGSAAATGGSDVVDLNTADAAALDALPGVGPVTAANIVAWRERHGSFTSLEQLQEIPGIGPAKFAQLAPHLRL